MSEFIISGRQPKETYKTNVKNAGGSDINPATSEKQDEVIASLTDQLFTYKLSDIDDSSDPVYIGYLRKDGAWYIQKIASNATVTYAKGASGYMWSNRASETYAIFSTTF